MFRMKKKKKKDCIVQEEMDVVLLNVWFAAQAKHACLRKPKWSISIQDS